MEARGCIEGEEVLTCKPITAHLRKDTCDSTLNGNLFINFKNCCC